MRFSPGEGLLLALFGVGALISGASGGAAYAAGHVTGALVLAYILILGGRKLKQHG